MAKDTERTLAQVLFVHEGKTAKEIAAQLQVNEGTLSGWVKKGNWKALRDAHTNKPDKLVADLRELISALTVRRLELERRVPVDDEDKAIIAQEKVNLADEVAKWNKTLEKAQDDSIISLADYIRVCEDLFPELYKAFPRQVKELAEFQRRHIDTVAMRYA